MHDGGIPIWFFIGLTLLLNGVIITGAGLWDWIHPAMNPVVLYQLHANLWWGVVLTLVGAFYCYKFAPRRHS
jgi:hypothetical protein